MGISEGAGRKKSCKNIFSNNDWEFSKINRLQITDLENSENTSRISPKKSIASRIGLMLQKTKDKEKNLENV